MARNKAKYELLLKSMDVVENSYFQDSYDYYDYYDGDVYDYYDYVDYKYLDNINTDYINYRPTKRGYYFISNSKKHCFYKKVDMLSIYSKEKIREIKINKILGLESNTFKTMTFGDLIKIKQK